MTKARDIADLGGVTTRLDQVGNSDGALSNRNRVINGAMQVAQRGISSTTNSGYVTVDRFRISNGSVGNLTTTQESTNGPSGVSKYSMKVTATNTASLPAGSDGWIRYVIETKDIENLTLSDPSKHFTVSFYVKCSDTGQSSIGVTSGDFGSAQYVSPFTIANANTWQRVSVTIPCSSVLSNVSGDLGLRLYWDIGAGTTYQTSSTNQWVTGGKYASSGNLQITGVNGRYLQITGVQLELGDTSTDFEHISFGDQLQKCQRYYQFLSDDDYNSSDAAVASYVDWNGGIGYSIVYFPNGKMRTRPSITKSALNTFTTLQADEAPEPTSMIIGGTSTHNFELRFESAATDTAGQAGWLRFKSGGKLTFDAEL